MNGCTHDSSQSLEVKWFDARGHHSKILLTPVLETGVKLLRYLSFNISEEIEVDLKSIFYDDEIHKNGSISIARFLCAFPCFLILDLRLENWIFMRTNLITKSVEI